MIAIEDTTRGQAGAASSLLLLSILAGCGAQPSGPSLPNVLVVTIDTLRADFLGCYGNPGGHTPNLDLLAERGVVFRNAQAPIAVTFPSHSSMFTGVYPHRHGVGWNGHRLADEWDTLAERLSDRGFDTAAFVSYPAIVGAGGLGQGFDEVSDPAGPFHIRPGARVNELAFDWLDREASSGDAPFFLWVHYFEAHSPYPLTPYAEERLAGYEGPLADGADLEETKALKGRWDEFPESLRALHLLYEGRVREADRLLGELLASIDDRGLTESTLVVVAGDHGQLLGEHGAFGHGATVWEPTLSVPLIIADPQLEHRGAVDVRVGVVDITPTILNRLGMETPDYMEGRSLVPALLGDPLPPRLYYAERWVEIGDQPGHGRELRGVAVYHGHQKLIWRDSKALLFDLDQDPGELTPLKDTSDAAASLTSLARQHSEVKPGTANMERQIDAETLKELSSLGYIDGNNP